MNSREMAALHQGKLGVNESRDHSVMAAQHEDMQCMLRYEESKSVVTIQRNIRKVYQKDAYN
jgi:hypothetical protein